MSIKQEPMEGQICRSGYYTVIRLSHREIWLKWANKKMTKRAQSKQRAGPCLHFVATRKEFAPLAKKGCINVLEILFKVGLNTFPQYLAFHNPCDTMPTLT